MPIDDPQAVRFANERIRPAADALARTYHLAKQVQAEWTARGGVAMLPNKSDAVLDGAETDGRPVITGADVNNVINRLAELTADFEAYGAAKLNTILRVAVNPGA